MPWKETCPMDERKKFAKAWCHNEESFAQLCARFGISRKTGYKWVRRFEQEGQAGLVSRSRAPLHHPNEVSEAVEQAVLCLRLRYRRWGPDKLLVKLEEVAPDLVLPSRSTVARILKRHGLVAEARRRRRATPTPHPLTDSTGANTVWSIDYKGQFRLGNGQLCYPLTLCDHYSRYLLCCQGFPNIRLTSVDALLERVFRDYGLPDVMRSDNGTPFASTGLGGLTRLSVRWIKLGIRPERIQPGHPEQNGRHERMHRELKAEAAHPPKSTLSSQQRALDRFRHHYNHERPHQALGQRPPVSVYTPSLRPYPVRPAEIHYPRDYRVRIICDGGNLRWCGEKLFISHILAHEPVGLHEIDDDLWELYFGPLLLGHLNDRGKSAIFHPKRNNKTCKGVGSPRGETLHPCKTTPKTTT